MNVVARTIVIVAAPILGFAAAHIATTSSDTARASAAQTTQREYVDTPTLWVPFIADLRRIDERDGSQFIGRTFVASDGSSRNETGRPSQPVNSIAIKNIALSTFYRWTPQEGWTSQQMDLPPDGWNPTPVLVSPRMSRTDELVEGFQLIRTQSSGRTFFQAPALNMFTLVTIVTCRHDPAATCGTWYSNIRLVEPPADLLTPPAGVPITPRPGFGGIYRSQQAP